MSNTKKTPWWLAMVQQLNAGAAGALLAMKLTHVVTWSWFIILLPFWWPLILLVLLLLALGGVTASILNALK